MADAYHSFILLLLLLSNTAFSERCHPNDKKALLKIKKDLNSPSISDLISLWDPNTDCCDWENIVRCDVTTNRITLFNLIIIADLNRPIPAAVFDLVFLEELYFELANLTGEIPKAITNLSRLKYLNLRSNHLTGEIPSYLSQIKTLTSIDLSNNTFTGSIPASLSQLQNLSILFLNRNKLTGEIPESFSDLRQPGFYCDLSNNHLSREISSKLGYVDFQVIDVSGNKLEGDISFLFGKNKSLIYADFSRNLLEFDFSKVEHFPEHLGTLDLSHNRITGSLPVGLVESNLGRLNVSYNMLCGKIPVGGRLQELKTSSFIHNMCLCGAPLPKCL